MVNGMDEIIAYCMKGIAFLKLMPWYINLGIAVMVLVALFVISIIAMVFIEIGKTLFAGGLIFITLIIAECIELERVTTPIIIFGIVVLALLLGLAFVLWMTDEYYGAPFLLVILDCAIGGFRNVACICLLGLLVFIPLGFKCFDRD